MALDFIQGHRRAERIEELAQFKNWLLKTKNVSLTVRRIVRQTDPGIYKQFFNCFVINRSFSGIGKRRRIWKEEKIYIPSSINLSATMLCNLNCKGCYAGLYPKTEELDLSLMDKLILEAKQMGIYSFGLLGGEPLLRPDLFELFGRHKDVAFQLVTNGVLFDDGLIDCLQDLGNVLTIISIEGFKEKTDAWRGEGVYDRIIQVMKRLKEKRLIFGFSVTTTSDNFQEVSSQEFMDFMIQMGCCFGNYFLYGAIGTNPDFSLMLSCQQKAKFFEALDKLEKTRPIILIKEGHNDGGYLNRGCGAARDTLHIIPNGDVEPCAGIHFACDNIKQEPLKEILRSPFLNAIRENAYLAQGACLASTNPHLLREIIQDCVAHPTHEMAWPQLDAYCRFCSRDPSIYCERISLCR